MLVVATVQRFGDSNVYEISFYYEFYRKLSLSHVIMTISAYVARIASIGEMMWMSMISWLRVLMNFGIRRTEI